jgi:hypothetical protein
LGISSSRSKDSEFVKDSSRKHWPAYILYCSEVGASGTPHLQGYIRYSDSCAISRAIRDLPKAHVEICKGTEEENVAYCTKEDADGTRRVEYGVRTHPGKRNDIASLVEAVKTGESTVRDIFEAFPESYLKYSGAIDKVARYYGRERNFKTEVIWCWGSTGTGKSRWAQEHNPGAYWKDPTSQWWDGYDPVLQDVVIIDDYRRDLCTFASLLRLLDRYPLRVWNKGGSSQFIARRIIITAPAAPDVMWYGRTTEEIGQLTRRVDKMLYFDGTCEEGVDPDDPMYITAHKISMEEKISSHESFKFNKV